MIMLTPALLAEYTFLKQQVDTWIDESNRLDPLPNAAINLSVARRELTEFVRARRKEGYSI